MDETTRTIPPEEPRKPGFWAVLPATVRYDTGIPASAKILYAEISALTEGRGYCWAPNDYFERLYGITDRTVMRLLQSLEKHGYIRIEGGGTTKRRIYAGLNPLAGAPPVGDKNVGAGDKNVGAGDKNVTAIYNNREEQEKGTPPKAPRGGRDAEEKKNSAPHWKPERFEAFWRYYPAIPDGNGRGRRPAKDRAVRAWDKIRPDDATIAAMGAALRRQKESRQWKDGVGIPYASTWLNARTWEEESEDLPAPAAAPESEEAEIEWLN